MFEPASRRRGGAAVATFRTVDQAKVFQTATLLDVRDGTYVPPTAGVVPFHVVAEQRFAAQLQLKRRTQIT